MKKAIKKNKIGLIISLIFLVAMISVAINMNVQTHLSEKNTCELIATVEYISVPTSQNQIATIYTEDFNCPLYIYGDIFSNLDSDKYNSLSKGSTIYFRVNKSLVQNINNIAFCYIVSLRTDENVIFSIDNYNEWQGQSVRNANITAIVFVLILISLCIYFIYQIKRNHSIVNSHNLKI